MRPSVSKIPSAHARQYISRCAPLSQAIQSPAFGLLTVPQVIPSQAPASTSDSTYCQLNCYIGLLDSAVRPIRYLHLSLSYQSISIIGHDALVNHSYTAY